ncbi:MAG: hypothetical protein ACXACD_10530 [Candidatus Thorarchaeota archaeon]|jgi:hypothetical protein
MALEDSAKINLALKKIQGKAQTSNQKDVYNENLGSNVSIGAATIFGESIPTYQSRSYYGIIDNKVEKIRFSATPIAGTKDDAGLFQGFELRLPSDYEANSSNPKAGTGNYVNGKVLNSTNGTLQIIPPSFGNGYTAKTFHTSSGTTEITPLDERDWVLDYFNGVFFQQDPPANSDYNPVYIDGFLYIADYVDQKISGGGGGGATGQGPINAIQIHTGSGGISGSGNFTYDPSTNEVNLSGNLIISGNITAHTFDVIHTDFIEIDVSGSTFFGDSIDDVHVRTGSLSVMSSSAEQFKVDVINKVTSIDTGMSFNRISTSTNYTAQKSNYIIGVDSTSNPVTITLPDASTLSDGHAFIVKDEGGNAFNNNITISASGSQEINNSNTAVLQVPYSSIQLYCNGTNKFFIF